MTIVADTNILPRSTNLGNIEFGVLLALARETGEQLVLPSLVLEEAVGARLREIEKAFDALQSAHRSASKYGAIAPLAESPIPGELAREFQRELETRFQIADLPEGGGDEALRREIHRLPPAREGRGARDVGIWLTVRSIHDEGQGPTYFLSANTHDFGEAGSTVQLNNTLRDELTRDRRQFHYCTSVADLLELLAEEDDPPFLTLDFIQEQAQIEDLIIAALLDEDIPTILNLPQPFARSNTGRPIIVWSGSAQPLGVSEARAFRVENRRVGVGWTRWEFELDVTALSLRTGEDPRTIKLRCQAAIQLWATLDDDGEASFEVAMVVGVKRLLVGE